MGIDVPPNEVKPVGEYEDKREIEETVHSHIPGYRTDDFKRCVFAFPPRFPPSFFPWNRSNSSPGLLSAPFRYTERLLGFPSHLLEGDTLAKFIKMDRKVLKVFCVWDNRPQLFGDLEYFVRRFLPPSPR
jgi:hypothetical protein